MSAGTVPGLAAQRVARPTRLLAVCLGFCFVLVLGGQLWGLKGLLTLNSEQRSWEANLGHRQALADEWQKRTERSQKESTLAQESLQRLKAELGSVQADRDRIGGELAKVAKDLELAQKAQGDAFVARQSAIQQAQQASATQVAAETRTTELVTKQTILKTDIGSLQAERDRLLKVVEDGKVDASKLNDQLSATQKQLGDSRKQIDSAQATLRETQAAILKSSGELDVAIAENGKLVRKREELTTELAAAEQKLVSIRKDQETVSAAHATVLAGKADTEKALGQLQTRLADLQKQVNVKSAELDVLQSRLDAATAEEQRLQKATRDLAAALRNATTRPATSRPGDTKVD